MNAPHWLRAGMSLPALLLALTLASCSREAASTFNGYVEADYVRVASPVAGRLISRPVMRGDEITAGTLLFTLNAEDELAARNAAAARLAAAEARWVDLHKGRRPEEIAALAAALRQAEAALELSTAELRRVTPLVQSRALAAGDLDTARSNEHRDRARVAELTAQIAVARLGGRLDEVNAAEAEVKAAREDLAGAAWRLQEKSQRSPVTGRVEDTLYEPGEWIPAGTPVLTLLPPGNVKIRFFLPEERLATLAMGSRLLVHADGLPEAVEAAVSYISSRAEYTPPVIYSRETREKLVYLCEASPISGNTLPLHPGQPVEVRIAPTPSPAADHEPGH